jgi:hypothetical protein
MAADPRGGARTCASSRGSLPRLALAVALALGSALTIGTAQAQDIKIAYNADMSGTAVAELGVAARWGF